MLGTLLDDIIVRDPTAVIVIAGDHGPFIVKQCAAVADLGTVEDYRDRAGVILAIKWPENYDGIYDQHIITTVNNLPRHPSKCAHRPLLLLD